MLPSSTNYRQKKSRLRGINSFQANDIHYEDLNLISFTTCFPSFDFIKTVVR